MNSIRQSTLNMLLMVYRSKMVVIIYNSSPIDVFSFILKNDGLFVLFMFSRLYCAVFVHLTRKYISLETFTWHRCMSLNKDCATQKLNSADPHLVRFQWSEALSCKVFLDSHYVSAMGWMFSVDEVGGSARAGMSSSPLRYMFTAVCGHVKMPPSLVPPSGVLLIPLASSLQLSEEPCSSFIMER